MEATAPVLQGHADSPSIWVLQVEDNPGDVYLVDRMLGEVRQHRYRLVPVATLGEARERLSTSHFDVVLLDLSLPDSNGLQTLQAIADYAPATPIVLLTGMCDDTLALEAVQHGAQDYLVKGQFNSDLLMRVIHYAIDRKQAERALEEMARYDALTGLANRRVFYTRLKAAMRRVSREPFQVALLFLDLDHFKAINDHLGHEFGDLLLQAVAERLRAATGYRDTIARLGGDEFAVLLEDKTVMRLAGDVAQRIVDAVGEPYRLKDREVHTSTSVGIALYTGKEGYTPEELLKYADAAMYGAKRQGRNRVAHYDRRIQPDERSELEDALARALERGEFFLEYQPQIRFDSGRVVGAEALLRWRRESGEVLQPDGFLPVLEHMGLLIAVGEWVLHTACRQWHHWQIAGVVPHSGRVAVNVSVSQFWQRDLADTVSVILDATGLPPGSLELELTERLLSGRDAGTAESLRKLKALGVRLTAYDFGSGFTTLDYLKQGLIDCLKVDRRIVRHLPGERAERAIAAAVIGLARNLDLEVVAEGVDSDGKIELLKSLGCEVFQGYCFSAPLPVREFEKTFDG